MEINEKLGMKPAEHPGEKPDYPIDIGCQSIEVRLVNATEKPYLSIYKMIMATWGNSIVEKEEEDEEVMEVVRMALAGGTLGNALESVNFTFEFHNVSRACTHQIVRTRIGAGFAQQGGRDNDWRHQAVRMPRNIAENPKLKEAFLKAVQGCKEVYAMAVDAGVPYQDARYAMPIGSETYIIATYNLRALLDLLNNRLCNCMQWEINYVAQGMRKEVQKKYPLLGGMLKSRCERVGKCVIASNLFPPCRGEMPDRTFRFTEKQKQYETYHVHGCD